MKNKHTTKSNVSDFLAIPKAWDLVFLSKYWAVGISPSVFIFESNETHTVFIDSARAVHLVSDELRSCKEFSISDRLLL